MLQSMGSQRVGHNWATEQQQEKDVLPKIFTEVISRWPNAGRFVLFFFFPTINMKNLHILKKK